VQRRAKRRYDGKIMNLDELRTVQSKERSKDSLQHLRESFYADVADYIADLKEQREQAAERADSPFDDPEVNRLTDEVKTAEDVVEAVYERRVGKIVKRASLAAAGMPADEEGLTNEEQDLFTELVERIEANKSEVLDILAGESDPDSSPTPTPADSPAEVPDSPAAVGDSTAADSTPEPGDAPTPGKSADASAEDVSAADVMGETDAGATESPPASADDDSTPAADSDDARPAAAEAAAIADGPDDDRAAESSDEAQTDDLLAGLDERTTVRITDDVGEIFGVDERTYELASEDVVTLPEANAAPLVERGAAEELE
jgi:DNA replication factor GINS